MAFSMGSATTVVCETYDATADSTEAACPVSTCRHLVQLQLPDDISERTLQVRRATCDQQCRVMCSVGASEWTCCLSAVSLSVLHRVQSMDNVK